MNYAREARCERPAGEGQSGLQRSGLLAAPDHASIEHRFMKDRAWTSIEDLLTRCSPAVLT